MKLTARMTNRGIELALHVDDGPKPLEPAPDAGQENPRRNYVYAHLDSAGKFFYVGKGDGRRAWSKDRHPLWRRYVEKHLGDRYQVRILQDNLSTDEAEEVEADWIAQCSEGLVNWQNMGRPTDLQALDQFHNLRNANRALIQQAKTIEKGDLAEAVRMYLQAVEAIRAYAFIDYEKGLVGQLLREEADEFGRSGEIEALDRLSICLIKLGRVAEAANHANSYFELYRLDTNLSSSQRIAKRIRKALARAGHVRKQQQGHED